VCKLLYYLTEKGVPFHWGPEQEEAFNTMKKRLTAAPILAYPNEQDSFVLDTDASNTGIGAVLSQVQDGQERVIAYASRVLTKAERNYCVTRRELLAIVVFVRQFHHYLVGRRFLLRTDHAALYWLFGTKELEGQPARWVEKLNHYDMVIQHRPGVKHGNADALSRCPQRCRDEVPAPGSFEVGTALSIDDFRAIKWLAADYLNLDHQVIASSDSAWSDDQWENPHLIDSDTANRESLAALPAAPVETDSYNLYRVQTRAQARADPPDKPASETGLPLPAAKPKRTAKPAQRLTGKTGPADVDSDSTGPLPLARRSRRKAVRQPNTDSDAGPAGVEPKPAPNMQEVLDLQKQQTFLRAAPPIDWTDAEIAHMQATDPDVAQLLKWCRTGQRPSWQTVAQESGTLKTWWARWAQLTLSSNGVLYIKWAQTKPSITSCPQYRVVTPRALQPYILREMHNAKTSGHLGIRKTRYKMCKSRFYWPGMGSSAMRWVRNCLDCGARKHPQHNKTQLLQNYRVGSAMDRVSIDILGPFNPRTTRGNKCILTVTDHFTRWCEAYALPDQTANHIARCVVDFLARFGICRELHSDQGANVDGTVIREVCRLMGILKTHTSPYHPAANGLTERENAVIVAMLSHYVNHKQNDWDDHLPVVMMAYRATVHRILGETPAAMMLGREMVLPIDRLVGPPPEEEHEDVSSSEYVQNLIEALRVAHRAVRDNVDQHYRYQKVMYDRKVAVQKYYVGQAVWLRQYPHVIGKSKKLMRPYSGPCIVLERTNDVTYLILLRKDRSWCVHGDRLKTFYADVEDKFLRKYWVPLANRPVEGPQLPRNESDVGEVEKQ
jgi:transposase InsO family protein